MQPQFEVLLEEGLKDLLIVVNRLLVLNLLLLAASWGGTCRRRGIILLRLAVIRAATVLNARLWRLKLVSFAVHRSFIRLCGGSLRVLVYRRVDRKLYCHLVVVGEDCHGVLIADYEVKKGGYDLPWLELVRFVVDSDGVEVSHERAVSIVGVQRELPEGAVMYLRQGVHVVVVGELVPSFGEPVGPIDQRDWV